MRDGTIPAGTVLDIGLLDLQAIGVMRVQIAQLQTTVLEKLSVRGRPGPLVTVLGQSIETLNDTIKQRNNQVAAYQASSAPLNE